MNVEIIRGNKLIAKDIPYSAETVKMFLNKEGIPHGDLPARFTKAIHIASVMILPVLKERKDHGPYRIETTYMRIVTPEFVKYVYESRPMTVLELRALKKRQLSVKHDEYEAGAFQVGETGSFINVSTTSLTNIRGVISQFKYGINDVVVWRCVNAAGSSSKLPLTNLAEAQEVEKTIIAAVGKGFAAKEHIEGLIEVADTANALIALSVDAEFDTFVAA